MSFLSRAPAPAWPLAAPADDGPGNPWFSWRYVHDNAGEILTALQFHAGLTARAVIIALISYTMNMEKLKQIATLKLIGAPDRTIIGMIVQQALALGLIGFATGATLILNVKDYFPRRVVLEPDNVLVLAAIVFVVCLLSSGLGVRAALRVDPGTALGG